MIRVPVAAQHLSSVSSVSVNTLSFNFVESLGKEICCMFLWGFKLSNIIKHYKQIVGSERST